MGDAIASAIKRVLENMYTGEDVSLELVFDPPWSHERISKQGQEYLNK